MEKIITRVSLFRWGVKKWQEEVNAALKEGGWRLGECWISQPRVRILCYARLFQAKKD